MTPPINIDGTDITGASIDGQDVSEITVDGQTAFSAIPDSVIDDFEDDDLTEYSGSTGDWTTTASDVVEGTYALAVDTTSGAGLIRSLSGDGLDYYPTKGDEFSILLRENGGGQNNNIYALFGLDNSDNGYGIRHDPANNIFRIARFDNGSPTSLTEITASMSKGTWYDYNIKWHDGSGDLSDNTIEVSVHEIDTSADLSGELGRTSQINSGTATDSNHATNSGIGILSSTGLTAQTTAADRYWHLGSV